jgi:hypothetical protein
MQEIGGKGMGIRSKQQSDLQGLQKRSEQGSKVLVLQRDEMARNRTIALRLRLERTGVLASAGGASCWHGNESTLALFFELNDGKIVLRRNYDCFELW